MDYILVLFSRYGILIIAITAVAVVQLIVKYRLNLQHGEMPSSEKLIPYLFEIFKDPWMWLAGIILLLGALFWYYSLSRVPLSIAFAFGALSYPLVMLGSKLFLGEIVVMQQYIGCGFIIVGLLLIAAHY